MAAKEEMVPLKEAIQQVQVALTRLALMHLAFAKTLVEELGEEKGKDLILRSILEYGRRVGERSLKGGQDLPFYGVHETVYKEKSYLDTRQLPQPRDFSQYRVYNCALAKIFCEYGEEDLGRLYCYVDPAKSMAADPKRKLIHTACAVAGSDCCTFAIVDTTPQDREAFRKKSKKWKEVDPVLAGGRKGAKGKGTK